MRIIIGYFVFEQSPENYAIKGKFCDVGSNFPFIMAGVASEFYPPWQGRYATYWLDGTGLTAEEEADGMHLLRIIQKQGTDSIYTLLWGEGLKMAGEGMVVNGKLFGCYWNPELQKTIPDFFRFMDAIHIR